MLHSTNFSGKISLRKVNWIHFTPFFTNLCSLLTFFLSWVSFSKECVHSSHIFPELINFVSNFRIVFNWWQFSLSFVLNLFEHWKQENFLSSECDFRGRAKFLFGINFPQVLLSSLSILKLMNNEIYMCSSVLNWISINVINIIQMLCKITFTAINKVSYYDDQNVRN